MAVTALNVKTHARGLITLNNRLHAGNEADVRGRNSIHGVKLRIRFNGSSLSGDSTLTTRIARVTEASSHETGAAAKRTPMREVADHEALFEELQYGSLRFRRR